MKRLSFAMLFATFMLAGCINPTVSTIKDTKVDPTYVPPKPLLTIEPQKKVPDAYRELNPGRTYSLTLKNADINDVLMLLSKESGIPIVGERGLRGYVKIEAQNRKLGELLFAILKPLGYTASVENGIIMVGRPQLTTRTFRVNYIKDKRNSTSNMNVSGFSSSSNSGNSSSSSSTSSSGSSSGSVSVSSESKSDFWGALESSLELMVFGTSGQGKRDSGGYIRSEIEKKLIPQNAVMAPKTVGDKTSPVHAEVDDPMLSSTQLAENRLKQLLVNELAGIIQVTDYPENLDKIADFIAEVEEGSKRQVLIQAHIMEVNLRDAFSLGVNWETVFSKGSTYGLSQGLPIASVLGNLSNVSGVFKFSAQGKDFDILLDALKDQGNINMLSSPKISALNNQKAVIKLTTKQVSWIRTQTTIVSSTSTLDTTYQPQIDEVGIFLDVTPQIAIDGKVTMQVHPSVSEVLSLSSPAGNPLLGSKPIINVREIDTMVEAKTGETIVIAGLISDKLTESKKSVPLLGDIPYLGALFSQSSTERSKSELVIMLTPYVLNARSVEEIKLEHEKRMQEMGGAFHLINNLGSLITEKSSRDWIMKTNRPLIPTCSQALEHSAVENDQPVQLKPSN